MGFCVYRNPDNKVMAGPFDTQAEAQAWLDEYPYDHNDTLFIDSDGEDGSVFKESYAPMQLLREMMQLDEAKKPLKKAAKAVYHRDYMKTRNKPYRKYDPDERKKD